MDMLFEILRSALLEALGWMDTLFDILRSALPEALGALIAAAILALLRQWIKRGKPKPPFNIPRRPPRQLRGRVEEQDVIKARILGKDDHVPVAAITGMPGVGKTTLAIWVAHDVKRKFRDGVAWVTWRSTEGQGMLVLLQRLGLLFHEDQVTRYEDTQVCAECVLNVLRDKRALIVLDDVPEDRVKELEMLLPPPERCAALVTSRGKGVPGVQPGGEKELDVLDEPDALALLEDALGEKRIKREEQAALRICKLVYRHPLALTIVAGLLADESNKWSLEAYAKGLEAEKERLDRLEDRKKPEGKESSVRYSVALSYRLLNDRDQRHFRLLAMLKSSEFHTKVVAALWDTVERGAGKGLDLLARRSLVERVDEQRWRVHVLLRLFGEEYLQQEERIAAGGRLAEYYTEYVKLYNKEEEYLELDGEWENLQHAMHWAKEAQKDEAVVQLALETRAYFDKRGWWRVKRDWLREGVEAARRLGSQEQLLVGLDALGAVCIAHGPYPEARDRYQEIQELCTEIGDLARQTRALHRQGEAETLLGWYSKARKAYNQALVLYKRHRERVQEAQATEGIGRVLLFQREYVEAKNWYGNALDLWKRLGKRKELASALCGLADVARMENSDNEASKRYFESLELYRQFDSKWGDRIGLGNVLYGKGEMARQDGQNDRAQELYRTARFLHKSSEHELGQAQTLEGLGLAMQVEGNYIGACGLYEEAFKLLQELGQWPGEARVAHQLGEVAYIENSYPLAQKWYNYAFELYREKEIEEPWRFAETALKAGEVARLQGHYANARQRYEEAKRLFEQQKNKRGEADVQYGLGDMALVEGNIIEAQGRLKYALELYQELDNSPGLARVRLALGEVAVLGGKRMEAREHYEAALALCQKLDDSMGQARALLGLGRLEEERYHMEGNLHYHEQAYQCYENAYQYYEMAGKLYEGIQDRLGRAQTLLGLGKVAHLKHERQVARGHLEEALGLCRELGVSLEEAQALQGLGEVAWLEGEDSEAQNYLEAALVLYEQIGALQGQAQALVVLGEIEQLRERYPEARQYLNKAKERYRKQGLHAQAALVHLALGELEIAAHQIGEARKHYGEAIRLYEDLGDQVGEAQALRALAQLEEGQDLVQFAAEHYAQALTIMDGVEGPVGEQIWQELTPVLEDFRELSPKEFEKWQEMRARELEKWHDRWG